MHADVDEALRLMEVRKQSLYDEDDDERESDRTATSKIYRLIRDMRTSSGRRQPKRRRFGKGPSGERDMDVDEDEEDTLSMVEIRSRVLGAGFTEPQLMDTIDEVRCKDPLILQA